MDFASAMNNLLVGKRIRRKKWNDGRFLFMEEGDAIRWNNRDSFTVVEGSITATDWEVIEEPPTYYTFKEVCEGVRNGKRYRLPHWINPYAVMRSPTSVTLLVCMDDETGECVPVSIYEMLCDNWVEVE